MTGPAGLVGLEVAPDVLAWIADGVEPAATWLALTALGGRRDDAVATAHRAALVDFRTEDLVGRLPDWRAGVRLSGHDSPAFAPSLLGLLADMGVAAGDDPRVDAALDALTAFGDSSGRLGTYVRGSRAGTEPAVSTLLCDSHAIVEALVRFGRAADPAVRQALDRMAEDMTCTAQGAAWPCLPSGGFRGPGRPADPCPQVTVEALRAFGRLPAEQRPAGLADAVRAAIGFWRHRGTRKPYMFGHGRTFKTIKWPPFWYGALALLDAIAPYPDVWSGPAADPGDRAAVADLAACLLAYNVGADGRVIPQSCYRGFEAHTFGQKKVASRFATARVAATIRRFEPLAAEIAAVDVTTLESSKGGRGGVVPPRIGRAAG